MKLCLMSDIHNQLHRLNPPPADVLIIAGDLTMEGLEEEFIKLNNDLKRIRHKYKKMFVMAGNHDFLAFHYPEKVRKLLTYATYVEDESVIYEGKHFYFSPWTPQFGDWAFMYPNNDIARNVWSKVPDKVDVLVTHGPPAGVSPLDNADSIYAYGRKGCPILGEVVFRIKPKYHVFGHIHEGYGSLEKEGITFLNVASLKRNYYGTNPAVVIEV